VAHFKALPQVFLDEVGILQGNSLLAENPTCALPNATTDPQCSINSSIYTKLNIVIYKYSYNVRTQCTHCLIARLAFCNLGVINMHMFKFSLVSLSRGP
jgi:hypothetical protein